MNSAESQEAVAAEDQARQLGWRRVAWDVAKRAVKDSGTDHISIISAGLAFYSLTATVPAFAAMIAVYGLIADPAEVQDQINALSRFVPANAWAILQNQLNNLVRTSSSSLSLRFLLSLAIAFWSASRGIINLIKALNIAYDVEDTRGFIKGNVLALVLTILAIAAVLMNVVIVVGVPVALSFLGLQDEGAAAVALLRWPLFAAAGIFGLMACYRYAPARERPDWSMTAPGAVTATVIWLVASIGFSIYVSNFGSYDKTYGSLGAVIVLLFWFYLSSLAILFGAEVNQATERMMHRRTRGKERHEDRNETS